jgi:DNA-binding MarR family transcriptional regulator
MATTSQPHLTSLDAADTGDTGDVAARLRLVIARLARQLRHHTSAGLTPSQHSALASVDIHGPLRLGDLARREQVTPPTITRIVSRLEDDGLVVRTTERADRRHAQVRITDEGRRRMAESRHRRTAWLAERLGSLAPADQEHLRSALPVLEALAAVDTDHDARR